MSYYFMLLGLYCEGKDNYKRFFKRRVMQSVFTKLLCPVMATHELESRPLLFPSSCFGLTNTALLSFCGVFCAISTEELLCGKDIIMKGFLSSV